MYLVVYQPWYSCNNKFTDDAQNKVSFIKNAVWLYSVPFFCFYNLLLYIWINLLPKPRPLNEKKIQSVLKHSLYNFRFQNTTRIRQSTHCIANDMKTTCMITLKNCTGCPEYFQMEKICKFSILNIRKKVWIFPGTNRLNW